MLNSKYLHVIGYLRVIGSARLNAVSQNSDMPYFNFLDIHLMSAPPPPRLSGPPHHNTVSCPIPFGPLPLYYTTQLLSIHTHTYSVSVLSHNTH